MTDTLAPEAETTAEPTGLRKVAAMSASLVGTYAVTSALGVLFWPLAARQFPIGSVGVAGAAVAMMMLLGTLGTCGLGTLLIARLPTARPGPASRARAHRPGSWPARAAQCSPLVVPFVAIEVFGVADLRAVTGAPGLAALFAVGTGLMAVSMVLDQAVLTIGSGNLQLERNTLASVVKLVALLGPGRPGRERRHGDLPGLDDRHRRDSCRWSAWRTRGGLQHDQSTGASSTSPCCAAWAARRSPTTRSTSPCRPRCSCCRSSSWSASPPRATASSPPRSRSPARSSPSRTPSPSPSSPPRAAASATSPSGCGCTLPLSLGVSLLANLALFPLGRSRALPLRRGVLRPGRRGAAAAGPRRPADRGQGPLRRAAPRAGTHDRGDRWCWPA